MKRLERVRQEVIAEIEAEYQSGEITAEQKVLLLAQAEDRFRSAVDDIAEAWFGR